MKPTPGKWLYEENPQVSDRAQRRLQAQFDALYAQMQTKQSHQGIDRLFTMSAEEMNRITAAVLAKGRDRGRSGGGLSGRHSSGELPRRSK
jgi:hypothetical protein